MIGTPMTPQQKIDHIQAVYRQWLKLNVQLRKAQQDWQQSVELMQEMERFYFDGEWSKLHDEIANGLDVDLTTDGEYSVMSEDTLWNASCEYQSLLWHNLRFAIKHLDRQMPQFYGSLDNAFDEPLDALPDNEPSDQTKPSD